MRNMEACKRIFFDLDADRSGIVAWKEFSFLQQVIKQMKKREDELANPQDHFRHNEPRPMDEKMASQLHMRLH